MMRLLIVLTMAVLATPAYAEKYSEKDFKRCVQLKDLTLSIGKRADEGVTRKEMLSKSDSDTFKSVVNQVYDFHGAMTSQQMAKAQFDLCLKYITK